jgi:DNA-binding NarL/FixJ family response regulator
LSIVSNSRLLREGLRMLLAPYLAFRLAGQYDAEPCPAADVLRQDVLRQDVLRHDGLRQENHIALIDSSIGIGRCAAWTHFWREAPQPPRVILLEVPHDLDTIVRCIEMGISAYTPEGATPEEVAATIRLAEAGGATCPPEVTAQLFARLAARGAARGTDNGAGNGAAHGADNGADNGAGSGTGSGAAHGAGSGTGGSVGGGAGKGWPQEGGPAGAGFGGGEATHRAAYELRLLLTDREYEVLQHVVAGLSNAEIGAALTIEVRTVKQHVHNIFGKLQLQNRVQAVARAGREGWFRY